MNWLLELPDYGRLRKMKHRDGNQLLLNIATIVCLLSYFLGLSL